MKGTVARPELNICASHVGTPSQRTEAASALVASTSMTPVRVAVTSFCVLVIVKSGAAPAPQDRRVGAG